MARLDLTLYPGARTDLECPECHARLVLKDSVHGPFYGCARWVRTGCKGAHGAHPDGAPMGRPANAATKRARMLAHDAFDTWWRRRGMRRRDAYTVLRRSMDLPEAEAHISMFNNDQCHRVIAMVEIDWRTATQ